MHLSGTQSKKSGFTIVELLIVIVVIAILATISIVAYNGVQDRARTSALTSSLTQAGKKIALWQVDNPNQFPTALSDIGMADTDTISYQYTYDNNVPSYCLTATASNGTSYYISNSSGTAQSGVCSGYNILAWNKSKPETLPIPGAVTDTSTFRTSIASARLNPGSSIQYLRGNPFSLTVGQTYLVTLWVKSDSNWNGDANSKVRFGNAIGGDALLASCAYNGVKTNWTKVTCSYTAGTTKVNISVWNSGSIGNIWIDDLSLSLS